MTQILKNVMLVACLVITLTACSATFLPEGVPIASVPLGGEVAMAEKRTLDPEVKDPDSKIINLNDPAIVLASQVFITAVLIGGVVVLFYELGRALDARLQGGSERQDTYSYYNYEDEPQYYNSLNSHDYYNNQPQKRSVAPNKSLFNRVVDSIDPVEATFNVLRVESTECRRRAVCEVQQRASGVPLLGLLLQYISPSVRSMDEYREAQGAGADLEDCALLYQCSTSSLWDGQDQH